MKQAAYEIFIEQTHKEYVKKMLPTSNMGNMDQIYKGFNSLPKPHKYANGFEIRMWNLNGTITSPWFGGDFVEEYYKEDRDFYMVLELPDDIKEQVGSGSLIIELEVDTRGEKGWTEQVFYKELKEKKFTLFQEKIYTLHRAEKKWAEAEAECQRGGGHLASVTSEKVNEEVSRLASTSSIWLGGKTELGKWSWSDNSSWRYTKWNSGQGDGGDGSCAGMSHGGWWYDASCTLHSRHVFVHLSIGIQGNDENKNCGPDIHRRPVDLFQLPRVVHI